MNTSVHPVHARGGRESNWTGDRVYEAARVARASDAGGIQGAIATAIDDGLPLRVIGSGCSYTDIAHTTGVQLRIDGMDQILDLDPGSGLVRVQAGITLEALNIALERAGLGLPSLGEIQLQTLAGALATDTHGSGAQFGGISRSVQAVQLVTPGGELLELDGDAEDLLAAARVSLGALGVISEVTLQAEPAFRLRQERRTARLGPLLDRLDRIPAEHDHPEVFVFPYADRAMVVLRDRTEEPTRPRSLRRAKFEDVTLQNHVVDVSGRAGFLAPAMAPLTSRLLAAAVRPSVRIGPSKDIFSNAVMFPVVSGEWALPAHSAAAAVETLRELYRRERFAVSLPFLVRWAGPSTALLSPCHGRDTVYIEVIAHGNGPSGRVLRHAGERLADFGGRPHWGKPFRLTSDDLASRYPAWDQFQEIRCRLDPDGLLENEWTRRVLGPVR